MSRAAHATSPVHLPHVTPPAYGYLPAAHAAIHAHLPHVIPPAYGYLYSDMQPLPSTFPVSIIHLMSTSKHPLPRLPPARPIPP